jgi:glycosyltransferase involved in cell wall biosynthesis
VVNVNLIGRYYSDYAIRHFSRTRTKIILTPHSFYHGTRYRLIKRFFENAVFPYLLKKIDALIAFTEYEKSEWVSRYNVPSGKIVVIPHYISENDDAADIPKREGSKYVLYLGRKDINKLTDLLLRSFLKTLNNEFSLFLTLSPADVDPELQEEVHRDPRIKLLGFVSENEKQILLQKAEAVVFPPAWEAFGYSAFEAALNAKPLLCSSIPVFHELLDKRGVIFFNNNEDDLTSTLNKFFDLSEQSKHQMGEINKNNVRKYSFDSSLTLYKNLFDTLLSR